MMHIVMNALSNIAIILDKSPPPMDQQQIGIIAFIVFIAVTLLNGVVLGVWAIRRLFLEKGTFQRNWSFLDLLVVPQITLLVLCVLLVPLMVIMLGNAKSSTDMITNVGFLLPMLFIQNIAFFVVPAAVIRWKYQLPLREIGLPPLPKRRDVLLGVGLGLAAVAVFLPVEYGLTALAKQFSYLPWVAAGLKMDEAQPINALLQTVTKNGPVVLILAALAIGPGPGFGEEMLFRGFLFGVLRRRLGLWPGIVISGFVFSAVHGYFIGFFHVFLLGMGLAALYHKTGSLWTTIILHATNNSVLVLLAYFIPSLSQ